MPLYLTVSAGPRADVALPVLVVSERRVIDAMLLEIGRLAEAGEDVGGSPAPTVPERRQRTRRGATVAPAMAEPLLAGT
jgi:hypothetical protein